MNIKSLISIIPAMVQRPILFSAILLLAVSFPGESHCYPVNFEDSSDRDISVGKGPVSVVSLVPSITEIIFNLGAGESLKGITHHCANSAETADVKVVGGFLSPDPDVVEELKPDVIFYSTLQRAVAERFQDTDVTLVNLETGSIDESFRHIRLLGKIFEREEEALKLIEKNRKFIDLVKEKTDLIPQKSKKRVMRLMGRGSVMTPGDDSFQKDFVTLAGGIPPVFNRNGNVINITDDELLNFNPQVFYGCDGDEKAAEILFNTPELMDIDAVKNNRIHYFPCDLTCRAAANSGYFIKWLSATVYSDEFASKENLVLSEKVVDSRGVSIDLDYVKEARVDYSNLYDFINKSLIVEFNGPLKILSTLEGGRKEIRGIVNHYSSLAYWEVAHRTGIDELKESVSKILSMPENETSFLFTGADVDNAAIISEEYRDMKVYALVTAGVRSNAMRMSRDEGLFYEPGTINMLILPNMRLSDRAMTRAVITATEAKTAALQDMDIRSSYNPEFQATGTGTDNIIIAEGGGQFLDNSGGHTKMGELIAKAVYRAVTKAVYLQNSILAERNVFQRIKDRKIRIQDNLYFDGCDCDINASDMMRQLEWLLIRPEYASFILSAFSISDDYERGLITDLTSFKQWCMIIAQEISGETHFEMLELVDSESMPLAAGLAFNALLNGIYQRKIQLQ